MSTERLIYLPLGGAGEIGMNAYVYGYGPADNERLILVDLGVTFPDMDTTPGVDLIFPDMSWLIERRDRLEAVFITHAHEDHVGAIGHFFGELDVPVYARAFTANIARRKMAEHGHGEEKVKTVSAYPERVEAGPFNVSFVPVSHSIPESSGLLIESAGGRVFHTGDFKIDHEPIVGEPFDEALWEEISKGGIKAMVCDSTNIFSKSAGRSESELGGNIEALVKSAENMVVATTFASNVARVKTLAEAGERAGRSICLMGRAMRRMVEASVETGVLSSFPKVVSIEDARSIPRESLMLLVTGSQGERRAASAQLARGKFNGISLKEGDMFLFSSKTIPGNERGVISIINQFSEKGVDVVDDNDGQYHVSGHANGPDLEALHDLLKPKMLVPMHGEHRHLRAHACRNTRGVGSDNAATNDRDLGRTDTGNAAHQHATPSVGFLQGPCADLWGKAARNFGHWGQQRQAAVAICYCLICNCGTARCDQVVGLIGIGRKVEVCKQQLTLTQHFALTCLWLFDFDDHVGSGKDLFCRVDDRSTCCLVIRILKTRATSGAFLNDDAMAIVHSLQRGTWRHADAECLGLDLCWATDFHGARSYVS